MFNWIQNQLENGREREMRQCEGGNGVGWWVEGENLKWLVMCAGQHFPKGSPNRH